MGANLPMEKFLLPILSRCEVWVTMGVVGMKGRMGGRLGGAAESEEERGRTWL